MNNENNENSEIVEETTEAQATSTPSSVGTDTSPQGGEEATSTPEIVNNENNENSEIVEETTEEVLPLTGQAEQTTATSTTP